MFLLYLSFYATLRAEPFRSSLKNREGIFQGGSKGLCSQGTFMLELDGNTKTIPNCSKFGLKPTNKQMSRFLERAIYLDILFKMYSKAAALFNIVVGQHSSKWTGSAILTTKFHQLPHPSAPSKNENLPSPPPKKK